MEGKHDRDPVKKTNEGKKSTGILISFLRLPPVTFSHSSVRFYAVTFQVEMEVSLGIDLENMHTKYLDRAWLLSVCFLRTLFRSPEQDMLHG